MKNKFEPKSLKAKRTDWESVYAYTNSVLKSLEHGWEPSIDEKNKILAERAEKFAKLPVSSSAVELIELVIFTLAYETYAVESCYVSEVYPLTDIVPVPNTPDFVLGIISVRGKIVSVIELKKFFDLAEKGLTELNKVIILRKDHLEFGILVDTVEGIKEIDSSRLQKALPTLTGLREQYLLGVTNDPMVVLNAGKLLDDPKMLINSKREMA